LKARLVMKIPTPIVLGLDSGTGLPISSRRT
jgi:hypothetical protein